MSYEDFSVEESMALLHAIFPHYPATYGMKPTQEIGAFLRTLRPETSLVQAVMGQKSAMGRAVGIEDLGGGQEVQGPPLAHSDP